MTTILHKIGHAIESTDDFVTNLASPILEMAKITSLIALSLVWSGAILFGLIFLVHRFWILT